MSKHNFIKICIFILGCIRKFSLMLEASFSQIRSHIYTHRCIRVHKSHDVYPLPVQLEIYGKKGHPPWQLPVIQLRWPSVKISGHQFSV